MYLGLKLLHVFLAIVAVGFNLSYGIWLARAAREPEHLGHVLRGIKTLDDRFANPAYGLLLVTGLAMVFVGGYSLATFWIAGALVLYVLLVLMAVFLYSPALREQIATLEAHGPQSVEYRNVARRAQVTGIALAVPVLVILYLMVFKPQPV
jgi:uncharacterized membrane protein